MSYVTADVYKNTYKGNVIPDGELDSWLQKASDSIDQLTQFKIVDAGGLNNLTAHQQSMVILGVCWQADHMYQYGDLITFNPTGYNVNGQSMSIGSKDLRYSPQAKQYLKSTNLLYRGL
jgi:hypothetical protein